MNDRPDYTKAIISFAVSAFFLMMAFLCLPTVIISPQKFTMMFTIAAISMLIGLAFFNGPANYIVKLTERKNIIATCSLIGSMILSLYFSIINESYLLSMLFCFIEVGILHKQKALYSDR
jgi:hypothetical protein